MPHYFTVPQAERLLPEVERHLRNALFHRAEALKANQELEETSEKIRMAGGMQVNPSRLAAVRSQLDESVSAFKDAVDQVERTGALIKDLEIGLIDFISRFRDEDVCLCWKLGESGIRFWHGLEEGFRGRKPINQEFLEGHSGAAADSSLLN